MLTPAETAFPDEGMFIHRNWGRTPPCVLGASSAQQVERESGGRAPRGDLYSSEIQAAKSSLFLS